jgi:hypothetical protein
LNKTCLKIALDGNLLLLEAEVINNNVYSTQYIIEIGKFEYKTFIYSDALAIFNSICKLVNEPID